MSKPALPLPHRGQQIAWVSPPPGAALALTLANTAQQADVPVLAITPDTASAQALENDLRVFAGAVPVLHFPDWEILPYDLFAPHPDLVSQRIAALNALPRLTRGILVLSVTTLVQRLPPRSHVLGRTVQVAVGERLDLATEQAR